VLLDLVEGTSSGPLAVNVETRVVPRASTFRE
jgi:hypothetical protein